MRLYDFDCGEGRNDIQRACIAARIQVSCDSGTVRNTERFSAVMAPDAHGENGCYRITSVYLDDVYRTAYNDKLIGADTRKKYRIRTYDLSDKLLHFECKYKDRDMTSKRGI